MMRAETSVMHKVLLSISKGVLGYGYNQHASCMV
jgi:hypothetical protein